MLPRIFLAILVLHGCVLWLARCIEVADVSSSFVFSCARSEHGALKCWGDIRYLGLELGVEVPF